jgi:hypothetical protein
LQITVLNKMRHTGSLLGKGITEWKHWLLTEEKLNETDVGLVHIYLKSLSAFHRKSDFQKCQLRATAELQNLEPCNTAVFSWHITRKLVLY